jgi:hypothetical protein
MLLPYANPVISAAVLNDSDLVNIFHQCRKIHRDYQAGEEYDESKLWGPSLVYLMMVGDCMAREIQRRRLPDVETNLILQHPQNPFPEYWRNIIVPAWLNEIVMDRASSQYEFVWGPDFYPEENQESHQTESIQSDETDELREDPNGE